MAETSIELDINGIVKSVSVRGSDTLLQVLRDKLGLTGAKPGCRNGDCGGCAVLVDGRPMHSCLMLAMEALGHEITTIEGLNESPMQKAFIEHAAFQCGYCTPGFIINAHALANLKPNASDTEIDEWLASNLCRCTSYTEIREAVKAVLNQMPGTL